jgi:phosphoribosylformylglycinamidine cyclo-ligase
MSKLTYAKSGVDINREREAIEALSSSIHFKRSGFGSPLITGHYAGLVDFGEFALAMTTDGVGSKIIIANEMRRWDTIGIDCVAMNVNDLLSVGAEPIAFVDYVAMERPNDEIMREIGKGLEKAAEIANISIVGGETATLPEIINGLDLAGTCVGYVKKNKIITGEKIRIGDSIIGLESSGIHSNGLTLARKALASHPYSDPFYEKTIGEELLTPTRIYMNLLSVIKRCDIHGLAHITGGGLLKLKRLTRYGFEIQDPIEPQSIFGFIQEEGGIEDAEMYRTFNMGMGFSIILPEEDAEEAKKITNGKIVGEIIDDGIYVRDLRII